jgi:hypothetical protein
MVENKSKGGVISGSLTENRAGESNQVVYRIE